MNKDEVMPDHLGDFTDILSGKFCSNCFHEFKKHSAGKCYGLEYNGTVWSACNCRNFKNEVRITTKVEIPEEKKLEKRKEESKSIKWLN